MAIAAELETPIAAPPETVFATLADLGGYPRWLVASGVVGVERLDQGDLRTGSRLRIDQRIAGRAATLDGTVTALEPGRRIALRVADPGGITVELEATVVADGGGSRLRWAVRIGLPLRYRMFEGMAAPEVRRAATADLARLRARLEAPVG